MLADLRSDRPSKLCRVAELMEHESLETSCDQLAEQAKGAEDDVNED